jgi:cyclase
VLKKRVIPVLLLRDGRMVKGVEFENYRDTGNPRTAVRIYSAQDADELVFLDIQATLESRSALVEIVREASTECFMPLAAGGGIKTIEDVRQLLSAGADKGVVTTAAVTTPRLVTEISERYGAQCVVAGIDFRTSRRGKSLDPLRHGANGLDPWRTPNSSWRSGLSELFLNAIHRDGRMQGYELDMATRVASSVSVPVIVSGGAGHFMHLAELLRDTPASAAACASLFHFGDNNPIRARSYLRNLGIPMRVLK